MIKKLEALASEGFTLIELLVVIAIIGILATIVLASLSTARQKGATAAFKSEVEGVVDELEIQCDSGALTVDIVAGSQRAALTAASCDDFNTGLAVSVMRIASSTVSAACDGTTVSINGAVFPADC